MMWGRQRSEAANTRPDVDRAAHLLNVIRQVRVEAAERSAVVVDLHDAEFARLEILNEALDPLFKEIPSEVELFDRGISRGDPPRLWIDVIAHVFMARDKRHYRFVQDTRYGRKVLAESTDIKTMIDAVTRYVATRLIERERALASEPLPERELLSDLRIVWRQRRWRMVGAFVFGLVIGCVALFAALWIVASNAAH